MTEIVLTIDEIVEMLGSWGALPEDSQEARESVEGYVEHMHAGDFPCGRMIDTSDFPALTGGVE